MELIDREEKRLNSLALEVARAAAHGQGRDFLHFSKRLREHGA